MSSTSNVVVTWFFMDKNKLPSMKRSAGCSVDFHGKPCVTKVDLSQNSRSEKACVKLDLEAGCRSLRIE